MRLDDRATDREAYAHAVLLGRDERLKQLWRDGIANPRTGVLDCDARQDRLRRVPSAPKASGLRRHHRIDRIADEVDEHLLDLDAIDQDLVGGGVELQLNVDPMLARADQRERIRFIDEALQAFDPPFRFPGAHEVP